MLPGIVAEIAQRKCFHTGKGNFFTIETVDPNGVSVEYEIYFNLTRTTKKGRLRLFIQSAYVRDEDHVSAQPKKKPINFFVLAHNRLINKPIKTPK